MVVRRSRRRKRSLNRKKTSRRKTSRRKTSRRKTSRRKTSRRKTSRRKRKVSRRRRVRRKQRGGSVTDHPAEDDNARDVLATEQIAMSDKIRARWAKKFKDDPVATRDAAAKRGLPKQLRRQHGNSPEGAALTATDLVDEAARLYITKGMAEEELRELEDKVLRQGAAGLTQPERDAASKQLRAYMGRPFRHEEEE
jgi:hypothetical protein